MHKRITIDTAENGYIVEAQESLSSYRLSCVSWDRLLYFLEQTLRDGGSAQFAVANERTAHTEAEREAAQARTALEASDE